MSFREKRAWITLLALIGVVVLFWLHIPPSQVLAPPRSIHLLMLMIATFIAIELVTYLVMRVRSPREARTPLDEREQLIALKSTAVAFYVFAVLSLGAIFVTLHTGANEVGIGFVVLQSFVIAEIVNYAMRIYYYRRGF